MKISKATPEDAANLAYLINLAGEGIPEFLWSEMITGQETALEVGTQRAAREDGGFSYKNAKVVRLEQEVAGMIIAYQLDNPYDPGDLNDYPAVVRPLIELEAKAPGSWYINALATMEQYRGLGIAKALILEAEKQAKDAQVKTMSLIVAAENQAAKQLYLDLGYQQKASLPAVNFPNSVQLGRWELLIKRLK